MFMKFERDGDSFKSVLLGFLQNFDQSLIWATMWFIIVVLQVYKAMTDFMIDL